MDIKTFAVQPTSRLHLRDSSDEPMYADGDQTKPITVSLYGPGSRQYAVAQAAQQNRSLQKLRRKGKLDQTAEENAAESAVFLSACTEGFENMEYDGLAGADLAKAVYSDITIGFIADQVAGHLREWGNFTKPSTKG